MLLLLDVLTFFFSYDQSSLRKLKNGLWSCQHVALHLKGPERREGALARHVSRERIAVCPAHSRGPFGTHRGTMVPRTHTNTPQREEPLLGFVMQSSSRITRPKNIESNRVQICRDDSREFARRSAVFLSVFHRFDEGPCCLHSAGRSQSKRTILPASLDDLSDAVSKTKLHSH